MPKIGPLEWVTFNYLKYIHYQRLQGGVKAPSVGLIVVPPLSVWVAAGLGTALH